MNPRRPTPSGPKPDPFDLARAPPPTENINKTKIISLNLRGLVGCFYCFFEYVETYLGLFFGDYYGGYEPYRALPAPK